MIDISECPKNKYVRIFRPDGVLLVKTRNELMFQFIRVKIKEQQVDGYYLIFKGQKITIDRNGMLSDWPNGLFDEETNLLLELI